jgi:hypothetical protein
LDDYDLPCLWPGLLQNNVYCYLQHVVKGHGSPMYYLEEVERYYYK